MDQKHAQDLTEKYNELLDDLVPALRKYVTAAIGAGAVTEGEATNLTARAILTAALEDYGDQYTPRDIAKRKRFMRNVTNILALTPRP